MRVRKLEQQGSIQVPGPTRVVRPEDSIGAAQKPTEEDRFDLSLEDERRAIERKTAFLESEFLEEGLDKQWSDDTESFVWSKVTREDFPETDLRVVDCAATMCRFEAEHQHPAAYRSFMVRFVNAMGERLQHAHLVREETEDGAMRTRGFMARAGYQLPEPRQEGGR